MSYQDPIEQAQQLTAEAAHLYSRTIRRKETLHAAKEQASKITGEAASPDGSVRATVDAGGMLTNLDLAPDLAPRDLAQVITAVAQQAAARARAAVRELYTPLQAEGIVRDMPVLLPEPAPTPIPQRRSRRTPIDDEPSYEDAQSMLRSEDP